MKRVLSFLMVFLFIGVHFAQAQMINYDRRNRNTEAVKQIPQSQTTTTTSKVDRYSRYTAPKTVEETVEEVPRATNSFEQSYDKNEDGKLQKSEVQSLYQYVIQTIARRGSMRVNSDILKPFDKDEDGVIKRNEISYLKEALN